MPISLWRILLPRLYSAQSVRANLLWGHGRRAGAGLVGLEEAGSSCTQGWSWDGSSWIRNLSLRVDVVPRSSAFPESGSSLGGFESRSSAFPLSGNSLIPRRLFSSISRRENSLFASRCPGGVVGA